MNSLVQFGMCVVLLAGVDARRTVNQIQTQIVAAHQQESSTEAYDRAERKEWAQSDNKAPTLENWEIYDEYDTEETLDLEGVKKPKRGVTWAADVDEVDQKQGVNGVTCEDIGLVNPNAGQAAPMAYMYGDLCRQRMWQNNFDGHGAIDSNSGKMFRRCPGGQDGDQYIFKKLLGGYKLCCKRLLTEEEKLLSQEACCAKLAGWTKGLLSADGPLPALVKFQGQIASAAMTWGEEQKGCGQFESLLTSKAYNAADFKATRPRGAYFKNWTLARLLRA